MNVEVVETNPTLQVRLPHDHRQRGDKAVVRGRHLVSLGACLEEWVRDEAGVLIMYDDDDGEYILFTQHDDFECSVCHGAAAPAVDIRYMSSNYRVQLVYCDDCVDDLIDAIDAFAANHSDKLLGETL